MISFIILIFSSIFFVGIISQTKAMIRGRKRPSILQPLYAVLRLFKKGAVYSTTTSIIFKLAPIIYFSTVFLSVFFIPVGKLSGLLSFEGDFIYFVYLLGLGKFMMIIGAMDTGSSFEGMGANREALYSLLVEPAFFILMGSLALFTDHISFYELFTHLHLHNNLTYTISIVSIYLLIFMAMVENSRMPIDDPETHLELTMVHEVMVLDNSGFDLALIHIATWLKFAVFGALISDFIIPTDWAIPYQILFFFGIQILFAIIIGFLETFRARNKMAKNPQWLIMLSAIAIVVFLTTLIITNKIILH